MSIKAMLVVAAITIVTIAIVVRVNSLSKVVGLPAAPVA